MMLRFLLYPYISFSFTGDDYFFETNKKWRSWAIFEDDMGWFSETGDEWEGVWKMKNMSGVGRRL